MHICAYINPQKLKEKHASLNQESQGPTKTGYFPYLFAIFGLM